MSKLPRSNTPSFAQEASRLEEEHLGYPRSLSTIGTRPWYHVPQLLPSSIFYGHCCLVLPLLLDAYLGS